MPEKKLPYYNRELSWMDFNARVLEEATKKENPLMERLRFFSHHRLQPGRILHGAGGRGQGPGQLQL